MATKEVLVAIQELSLPRIAQALVTAQQRGIRVALVMENNYRHAWSEQRPSRLNPRERQRWYKFNRLADSDGDGTTTANEAVLSDAIALLQAANIPLIDDTEDGSSGSGLMHHKFLVIDQRTAITGSANLTSSGLHVQDWPLQQTCQAECLYSTRADPKPGHSMHARRHQRFSQASF